MTSLQMVTLVGLTAVVAALVGTLVFAVLRFGTAAREARQRSEGGHSEAAFVTSALQDAVGRLREQERHLIARAEASERLSGEIVAGLTSGLLLVEADGRVRLANPAARRLLGLPAEGELAGHVGQVLAGASPLADAIEEALRAGRPVLCRTVQIDRRSGDSPATHLGVTVSPVADGARGVHAAICLFTDLTGVMVLEEQVRIKDSLARLGELTAGLAHEFRNGLATIHGYAHMLDPGALPPAQATCVHGIRTETSALGEIVTNFLTFARPAQVLLTSVDLAAVVGRAADDVGADAERAGGRIGVAGEFARVDGDEVLLRQAFSNLCRNAVEAVAEQGGTPDVVVTGRVEAARQRQVVTVADNGPGIDPAALPRIFQPFFTTRAKGTGLGLALVQKIAVTHNGRVTAANRPGGGACFELVLPLPADPATKPSVD